MSTALQRVTSRENLARAWQWTRTNPERAYRGYCGDMWRAASLGIESRLERIRSRLMAATYSPDDATKLLLPKPSGVQRPYTILTVSDQIVYQAFTNIVAERLVKRIHGRYHRTTFGHLYAGKQSPFFYRDWKRSYRMYTDAMRNAFAKGYVFTASFDLTACYDSIDHSVVAHSLRELKLDGDFIEQFLDLLGHWTGFNGGKMRIYHGHGIPQGPLPSGLVAETVLRYFDDTDSRKRIKYFRYVDDIRLFARDERTLRKELVALDVRSKELGLFPQSSKIHIHRVARIEDEFKSISLPGNHSGPRPKSEAAAVSELKDLSPRFVVSASDTTRFKYVLGFAPTTNALVQRLTAIIARDPALYENVFRYIARVPRLTKKSSDAVFALLSHHDVYPGFVAALLRAIATSVHPDNRRRLNAYARKQLTGHQRTTDPQLYVASVMVLSADAKLTYAQMQAAISWTLSWWTRAQCLTHIREAHIGRPSLEALVHTCLRDGVADVALMAAERAVVGRLSKPMPIASVHEAGQEVLRRFGVIGRLAKQRCEVSPIVAAVLGPAARAFDWRPLFSKRAYRLVTTRFAVWRGYFDTDPTAWIALTDTINDILLGQLFPHDGDLGIYTVGKIGSVLNSTSRFAKKYPLLWQTCSALHDHRLQSDLAHALVRNSGKPTRRIRFRELPATVQSLRSGWGELHAKW